MHQFKTHTHAHTGIPVGNVDRHNRLAGAQVLDLEAAHQGEHLKQTHKRQPSVQAQNLSPINLVVAESTFFWHCSGVNFEPNVLRNNARHSGDSRFDHRSFFFGSVKSDARVCVCACARVHEKSARARVRENVYERQRASERARGIHTEGEKKRACVCL